MNVCQKTEYNTFVKVSNNFEESVEEILFLQAISENNSDVAYKTFVQMTIINDSSLLMIFFNSQITNYR